MSRELHLQLIGAVLGGEGLARVAQLVSAAARAPVAILVPRLAVAAAFPVATELGPLLRYADERVSGRAAPRPSELVAEEPVMAGGDLIGVVALLRGDHPPGREAGELLHLAAVASLTEVAVEEAKREVEQNLRGSLLEELLGAEEPDPREIARRAARLGCDLSGGAVALCAPLAADAGERVVATIAAAHSGALAQAIDARVYAILPALAGENGEEVEARTLASARRLARRLRADGVAGISSFHAEPAALPRALREAELVLDVLSRDGGASSEDVGRGTYRLLFRLLASHPDELRAFYADTVAPVVMHDDRHESDLVRTLEAYLAQDCNVGATAAAIGAHRHTVAHRLDRVKELTGLDPLRSEDRERIGVGLKASRLIRTDRPGTRS